VPRPKPGAFVLLVALLIALALSPAAIGAQGAAAGAPGAQLRGRFERMRVDERNPFGRPLRLDSRSTGRVLECEVYARVDHPFPEVERGLREARQWCQVLVLPFNVRKCEAGRGGLSLFIARHKDSGVDDTYRIDFRFRAEAQDADHLRIALGAPSGPFGTHDYRILLEAAPADARRTILHLTYSYGYGLVSQLAMRAYLATAGADNVGFTVEGRDGDGKPVYVRGMRGVMERNTMRYYLAIEAYLASLSAPPDRREDARLRAWFEAAERYPRQLHEMTLERYLALKHRDLAAASRAPRTASSSP
jgi:hypothetical protein